MKKTPTTTSKTPSSHQLSYRRRPSSTPGLKVTGKRNKSKIINKKMKITSRNFGINANKMRHAESRLSKDIDDRILQISRVLPPEMISTFFINNFMKKKGPQAVNLIVDRLITSKLRQAYSIWKDGYLKQKVYEKQNYMDTFNQQGGLKRIKRMVDKAMKARLIRGYTKWASMTLEKRIRVQTPPAIIIQKWIRRYLIRNWIFQATRACICIQHIWRGVVGRRLYLAAKLRRKQNKAAIVIQRNWRIVLAQMHATRLRLASAASAMSNLTGMSDLSRATTAGADGGLLGNLSAEADKLLQMAMNGELDMATVKARLAKLEEDVIKAKKLAKKSAIMIQCAWRQYMARETLLGKIECRDAATKIQSAYRMHRGKVYVQVIRSVNETLAAAHRHVEATKIQNSYKSYKERLMTQASLVAIINAIRESQRHVAAVTIQDAFRAKQMQIMMEEMEYQVQLLVDLNVRSMQRIVRGHLARVYVKNLKLQIIAARKI